MKIQYSGQFLTQFRKLITRQDDLRAIIDKRVMWFSRNPADTRLSDHPLRRRMKSYRAFSVTDDIRIIYEKKGTNTVRFLAIGTHRQVYR